MSAVSFMLSVLATGIRDIIVSKVNVFVPLVR